MMTRIWGNASQMAKVRLIHLSPEIEFLDADPITEETIYPVEYPWRSACALCLKKLKPRQRRILYDWILMERTLEQVADKHGISRTRVRQIAVKAMREIRNNRSVREIVLPMLREAA